MKRNNDSSLQLYVGKEAILRADLDKILGALGLAMNAGGLAVGSEAVTLAISRAKARIVFLANDLSDNTRDKLMGKLLLTETKYIFLPCNKETLARRLGKSGLVSAVALTRPGFEKIIFKSMEKAEAVYSHDNITEVQ